MRRRAVTQGIIETSVLGAPCYWLFETFSRIIDYARLACQARRVSTTATLNIVQFEAERASSPSVLGKRRHEPLMRARCTILLLTKLARLVCVRPDARALATPDMQGLHRRVQEDM